MEIREVVGVEVEEAAHRTFDRRAAAVVLNRVFGVGSAKEETVVVAMCASLPASVGIPSVPDSAESSRANTWSGIGG